MFRNAQFFADETGHVNHGGRGLQVMGVAVFERPMGAQVLWRKS